MKSPKTFEQHLQEQIDKINKAIEKESERKHMKGTKEAFRYKNDCIAQARFHANPFMQF